MTIHDDKNVVTNKKGEPMKETIEHIKNCIFIQEDLKKRAADNGDAAGMVRHQEIIDDFNAILRKLK